MSEPSVPAPPPAGPEPPPRTGRLLGGVLLILLGVAWLLQALGVVDLRWDVLAPAGLIAIGAVLVVNARTGASHRGLIWLGIVLTVFLSLGTVIAFPFGGGIGDRTEHPVTLAQATDRFELGIGQLTVDLTDLPLTAGADAPVLIHARVGIGQLVVLVPEGVAVRSESKAGLGHVQVFDRQEGGLDVELVSEPAGGAPELDLRLSVGVGEVRVQRG